MILEDDFIAMTLGAASRPLEWTIRIGLAVAVVAIGIMRASDSHDKARYL